jgi:hypothetical protein
MNLQKYLYGVMIALVNSVSSGKNNKIQKHITKRITFKSQEHAVSIF